jgi:hypothetical protein
MTWTMVRNGEGKSGDQIEIVRSGLIFSRIAALSLPLFYRTVCHPDPPAGGEGSQGVFGHYYRIQTGRQMAG